MPITDPSVGEPETCDRGIRSSQEFSQKSHKLSLVHASAMQSALTDRDTPMSLGLHVRVDALARSRASAAQALAARTDAALACMIDELKRGCLDAAARQLTSLPVCLRCTVALNGIAASLVTEHMHANFPRLVMALGIRLVPGTMSDGRGNQGALAVSYNQCQLQPTKFTIRATVTWPISDDDIEFPLPAFTRPPAGQQDGCWPPPSFIALLRSEIARVISSAAQAGHGGHRIINAFRHKWHPDRQERGYKGVATEVLKLFNEAVATAGLA